MIEYWAVIGLACLDDEFREELEKRSGTGKDPLLRKFLKREGFRLCRYEVGEVNRLISIPEIIECMKKIYESGWEHDTACWTGITEDNTYNHPVAENGQVILLQSVAQIKKLAIAKKKASAKKSAGK